jgi:uncharacterized protein
MNILTYTDRVLELYDLAASIPPIDSGHDFSHTERVAKLGYKLFRQEVMALENRELTQDEKDSIFAAALLHDCVPIPKNSPLRKESSRICSEKAFEILSKQKLSNGEKAWSADWIHEISQAILDHSFSSKRIPGSLLGECLQDADRLEALGAIGLYRTIATGVSMGAKLFDPIDPWAENRALDDQRFSLDHFYTKLFKLTETFCTQSGKIEANRRTKFLEKFVEQLKLELN